MNILSLFDGISCGRVALDRAGIPVNKYYASEIDKTAIKISQSNHIFYCVNEQCLAVISFGKAQSMKLAVNKFNKRKG